jgi:polysaccharide export outer membrane protein
MHKTRLHIPLLRAALSAALLLLAASVFLRPVCSSAQAVFGPDMRSGPAGANSAPAPGVFPGYSRGSGAAAPSARSPANIPAAPNAPLNPNGAPAGAGDNYIVSTNDSIRVDVFQEDDMTTIARVNKDGLITMPLLGQVKVAGLTSQDIAAKLRTLLAKDYFVNPLVTVTIMDFTAKRFILLGQVKSPGTYAIPAQESLDLIQAIAMAGGFTTIASPGRITVVRRNEGKEETFKVDAKRMTKDSREKPFEIQPGDVITVPESFF